MPRPQEIRWRERDAGEKLSIVMFAILGFVMVVAFFVGGLHKLINGPELTDRLFGAMLPVLVALWAFRGLRWWRARRAR
jgi:uncharacterized membrane protein